MSIAEFLNRLHQEGIELQVDGNKLKCLAPKGAMTQEIAKEVAAQKQEILLFLQGAHHTKWSSMVPIRPSGDLTPFFCFHGVGGNVLNYAVLEKYLAEEQPFYGLQSQGLDGLHPPLSTIEEMASHYLKEIQILQPHGPYLLGGGSMGGCIAFEAAHQLKAKGEKIAVLILFDTLGPNIHTAQGREQTRFGHLLDQLNDLGVGSKLSLLADKVSNKIEFHQKMTKCEAFLLNKEPLPLELRLWYIERQNYKAMNCYTFRQYNDEIILFRSDMEKEGWYSDPKRGWEGIATKLTILPVVGKHENLIEQPALGIHLNKALQNAQQKTSDYVCNSANLHDTDATG